MKLYDRFHKLKLSTLNYYAFWLHLLSAIGLAIYFSIDRTDINFNTTLYTYGIKSLDAPAKKITFDFGDDGPKFENTNIGLKTILGLIFFITALFHLYYYRSDWYEKEIKSGKNRLRWLEYGITATIMIYLLCIISGVKEIYTVVLLVCVNILLMSYGFFLEMTPKMEGKLTALIMGFFAFTVIFAVILAQFFPNVEAAKDDGYEFPDWIYGVLFPMVFMWLTFGIVAVLYYRSYNKKNFSFTKYERYYIFLSYISKAFMGYYLAFGLTRPTPEK